jgi:hypothetical protein
MPTAERRVSKAVGGSGRGVSGGRAHGASLVCGASVRVTVTFALPLLFV